MHEKNDKGREVFHLFTLAEMQFYVEQDVKSFKDFLIKKNPINLATYIQKPFYLNPCKMEAHCT